MEKTLINQSRLAKSPNFRPQPGQRTETASHQNQKYQIIAANPSQCSEVRPANIAKSINPAKPAKMNKKKLSRGHIEFQRSYRHDSGPSASVAKRPSSEKPVEPVPAIRRSVAQGRTALIIHGTSERAGWPASRGLFRSPSRSAGNYPADTSNI
jgi:hypothetical protein